MLSFRERNRLSAMRETQRVAMALFQQKSFERVTVEEIAEAVGMAPSTVYRHFGSKEQLVLWDEHDVAVEEALSSKLSRQPPLQAIRDAFVETLATRYDDDLEFQLMRIRYIYATPAIHAAAVEMELKTRDEFTKALEHTLSHKNKAAAPLIAGATLLALDVAMERWQRHKAKQPLGQLITETFAMLNDIANIV